VFYIYNPRSAFRRIARRLNVTAVFPYQERVIGRKGRTSKDINIGCAKLEFSTETLNANISMAMSKKRTFDALDTLRLRHPPVFATPEEATQWPYGWLGRRDGLSGGRGITIFKQGELPLQAAQYDFIVGIIPGKHEYRIHVGKLPSGEYSILATQQKMNVRHNENIIRNYQSGVRYSTQELLMSERGRERAKNKAIQAVQACGLDFGAVDMTQGEDGRLYILEINTAPGISSEPMFNAYLNYFKNYMEEV